MLACLLLHKLSEATLWLAGLSLLPSSPLSFCSVSPSLSLSTPFFSHSSLPFFLYILFTPALTDFYLVSVSLASHSLSRSQLGMSPHCSVKQFTARSAPADDWSVIRRQRQWKSTEVLGSQCSSDGPSHSHRLCPSKLSLLQGRAGRGRCAELTTLHKTTRWHLIVSFLWVRLSHCTADICTDNISLFHVFSQGRLDIKVAHWSTLSWKKVH